MGQAYGAQDGGRVTHTRHLKSSFCSLQSNLLFLKQPEMKA